MGQGPLPRWPRPPHRCSPRGPLGPHMGATIAPHLALYHLAPQWSMPLPTGRLSPEGATDYEAQGTFQGGGTVGVTALCSETMGVHHENFFASEEPDRSMCARGRCGSQHLCGANH